MKNVFHYLFFVIAIYEGYRFLGLCNIGWFRGIEITRLKKIDEDKLFSYVVSRILDIIFVIFLIIVFIIVLIFAIKFKEVYITITDITAGLILLSSSLTEKKFSVITKKGIFLDRFYKWEKVRSYSWSNINKVEFYIEDRFKCKTKDIEIFGLTKEETDKVLKKYTNYEENVNYNFYKD